MKGMTGGPHTILLYSVLRKRVKKFAGKHKRSYKIFSLHFYFIFFCGKTKSIYAMLAILISFICIFIFKKE